MFEKIKQYWVALVSLGLLAVSGLFVAQKQEMFGAGYNPVTGIYQRRLHTSHPPQQLFLLCQRKTHLGNKLIYLKFQTLLL